MSTTKDRSAGTDAAGVPSGRSRSIWGVQVGRKRARTMGLCTLAAYVLFVAILWTAHRAVSPWAPMVALAVGPVLVVLCARVMGWFVRQGVSFASVALQRGETPPQEVQGWHVSRELGIAVVSLRSGDTVWIDARGVETGAHLPAWLAGSTTQWGKSHFWEPPMSIGPLWIVLALPAAFLLLIRALQVFEILGGFYMGMLLILYLGPIVAIAGYIAALAAVLWCPSIDMEGRVAEVFPSGGTLPSEIRGELHGSASGRGQLELTQTRPRWEGAARKRWFRPAPVFTRKERQTLGFNEAGVVKRILEERARPEGAVYRAHALGSDREPNRSLKR
jgi:hypothetical protein